MSIEDKSLFVEMYEWGCATCGVRMTMPEELNSSLRNTHKTFWCINGHPNVYKTKTSTEEVEEKLMNEYAKNAQLEERIKKLEKSFVNRIFKP